MPKTMMTVSIDSGGAAACPECGHMQVNLFLATDTASCPTCSRVWHPSDVFYEQRTAFNTSENESVTSSEAAHSTPPQQKKQGKHRGKRKRKRRRSSA
jgi:hypothetical protein